MLNNSYWSNASLFRCSLYYDMIVQLGNAASETKCEDTFMSFYPHSSTSSKGNLEGQVPWISGLGSQARVVSSAVPSKAQAFHPGSSSIANLLSNRWTLWSKGAAFPRQQRRPNQWQTQRKTMPFAQTTSISKQVRQLWFLNKQQHRN